MEQIIERQNENGKMKGITWQFEGILMGHAISTYNALTQFEGSSENEVVRLHMGLKGDYTFRHKQLGKSYDLIGGHHNMMFSKGFDMTVYNKSLEIETFGVQFPKDLFIQFTQNSSDNLARFSDDILNDKSTIFSENWGSIDVNIQQVIQQILHCKYSDSLKKVFLLSKSLELLVLSAEMLGKMDKKNDKFIKTKTDKEKIIAVRDLINSRVTDPPNLTEIANFVGMNEYKLKRGFKEIFHNTIFGYLTDQRLNLAQIYLQDTEKTSAEIAYEMGYKTPQHFNNAFKKKFGTSPNLVRKNP